MAAPARPGHGRHGSGRPQRRARCVRSGSPGRSEEDEVGVTAPDATTLVVELRHPASYFLDIVATPATFVVPPRADATDDWQTVEGFVGSGPYVVEASDGDDLVLTRQRPLRRRPAPDRRGALGGGASTATPPARSRPDRSIWPACPGSDARWISFDAELGPSLHAAEPLIVSYFGFDTTRPPFDDPDVRRAFLLALDRERLVPLAEGAASQAAASLVPPAIWPDGFAPELEHGPRRGARPAGWRRLRGSVGTRNDRRQWQWPRRRAGRRDVA